MRAWITVHNGRITSFDFNPKRASRRSVGGLLIAGTFDSRSGTFTSRNGMRITFPKGR